MLRSLLLGIGVLVAGCAIDEEPICEAGETQTCACSTGKPGAQVCAEDALSWGECACEEPESEGPETCERDEDCESEERPLCLNFECTSDEGITILEGGARCDVPRSRCAEEFVCDSRILRCVEPG